MQRSVELLLWQIQQRSVDKGAQGLVERRVTLCVFVVSKCSSKQLTHKFTCWPSHSHEKLAKCEGFAEHLALSIMISIHWYQELPKSYIQRSIISLTICRSEATQRHKLVSCLEADIKTEEYCIYRGKALES